MTADIYANCNVITIDPDNPRAAALAVDARTGRLISVGNLEYVRAAAGAGAREVDLGGATVVPGFDDCHMHVLSLGLTLGMVQLSPEVAPTVGHIVRAVAERARSAIPDTWVLGRGYDQNRLEERRHPNRSDLDQASPDAPVVLWHTSGHVVTVNSRALELAGVGPDTPDPEGGEIERDASGVPTGVLKETAMDLVRHAIPELEAAQASEAILAASAVLARDGITSASDAATGQHSGLEIELRAYAVALASGRLSTRLVLMPRIQHVVTDRFTLKPHDVPIDGDHLWLKVGPAKIFSDGALTTRTAAVRVPYLDLGAHGLLTWPPESLNHLVRSAHDAGWQIATHAIGDAAIEAVLEAYEAALSARPAADHRHRIEHCTLADEEQARRISRLGAVCVLQPEDIAVLGDAYPPALGDKRAAHNSPVAWFQRHRAPIAFSSDRPVTPGHPLAGVHAAVERRTASGAVLGPEHRVTAEKAIEFFTAGGAYATFNEHTKGRLTPGCFADFVALDRDITTGPTEEITDARVLMTVVGGRIVYET